MANVHCSFPSMAVTNKTVTYTVRQAVNPSNKGCLGLRGGRSITPGSAGSSASTSPRVTDVTCSSKGMAALAALRRGVNEIDIAGSKISLQ